MADYRFLLLHAACMAMVMASGDESSATTTTVTSTNITATADGSTDATTPAPATAAATNGTGSTVIMTTTADESSATTTTVTSTNLTATADGSTDATTPAPATAAATNASLPTYGITLTCTATQMFVDIPKSLLTDEMAGIDVRFENAKNTDPDCWGSDTTNNFIRITTNLTDCGTNMTETDADEIYTNRVVNNYKNATFTRFFAVEIPVSCSYNRTQRVGSETVAYQLTDYTIDKSLSEEGQYTFEFDIYSNSTFEKALTDYPIRIALNEELFFAASVLSLDGTVDLSIDSCRATPTSSYDNSIIYDFIEYGCTKDNTDTNLTYLADYRIGVEMNTFRFVDHGEFVYIHCDLLVCDSREPDSPCNTDCVGPTPAPTDTASPTTLSRRRRDVSRALNTKRFMRGPLRVVRAAQNSISRMDSSETMSGSPSQQEVTSALSPWMVAMAAMATVVMVMAAVLVVVLRKVNKIAVSSEKRSLKEESVGLLQDPEI